MLEIDGSFGEGGGQIVRSALALAAVTNTDIKLFNIRANRLKPGLAPQHITAVKAVAEICNGSYTHLGIGVDKLEFKPGKTRVGKFNFDIGTAGSIILVLQACLPPAFFGSDKNNIEIHIRGGTDVKWSPPLDYFNLVFLKLLNSFGVKVEINQIVRGYYPQGGGEVKLKINPELVAVKPLDFTKRGKLLNISGITHSRRLPPHIPKRIKESAEQKLRAFSKIHIKIDESLKGISTGTGITLAAIFEKTALGGSALGDRGLPAERVGAEAAERLLGEVNGKGTVDIYAADQLVPYLAILKGRLMVKELSLHTKTNIWLVEQFFDNKFSIEEHNNVWKISY